MAIKPNETYKMNGVRINEKIIPDDMRWTDDAKARKAGFRKGSLYKRVYPLTNGTGKPLYITVHNTKGHSGIADEGELYTRATYNENMSSARVHFYVDNNGAWQNLKAGTALCKNDPEGSAEVGWHAGDGSRADGGNYTSIALEVIMGETAEIDAKAYDNSAKIVAWLLYKHNLTIDAVVSHTYWVNKLYKKTYDTIDEMCATVYPGKKWCPCYIFKSTTKSIALKNWKEYKAVIQKYLEELQGKTPTPMPTPTPTPSEELKVGDIVNFVGTKHYTNPNALIGKTCKSGKAKISAISATGKHKYHLIAVSGGGSTVYGWVNYTDITTEKSTEILVGDKVKLKADATVYGTKRKFAAWVYKSELYVRSITNTKVAFSINKTGAITGRTDIKNLTKI